METRCSRGSPPSRPRSGALAPRARRSRGREPHGGIEITETPDNDAPPPRELTARALLTGALLGALLAPCNIYAGLKIGWSFNMSVAAALLGFALWRSAERVAGAPDWTVLESNVNQTAASSAAAIAGAGLVAPIPALALLTGVELPYLQLVAWVFVVSLVGVVVALGLRQRFLEVDRLAFPTGVATAETLRQMYARGVAAARKVRALTLAGGVSATVKGALELTGGSGRIPGPLARLHGPSGPTLANLGFTLDPSLMLVGFGAIVGLRSAASLLLGAVVAWALLGPSAVVWGWAPPGPTDPSAPWFAPLVEWLLWPGVSLMVSASLTSFALSTLDLGSDRRGGGPRARAIPWRSWSVALVLVTVLAVGAQGRFFGIHPVTATLAVLSTFALAIVAGRVAGETGITPIGAMGKVSQLGFAVVSPADVTTNLMAANVTGGAASQCADLLHDLKTGLLVGARPRAQGVAQVVGVFAGALSGTAAYVVLIPDPAAQLVSEAWPAPAVVTWKAVAEVFRDGLSGLPAGAVGSLVLGSGAGVALAVAERLLPPRAARLVPSAASVGLGFVLPAWNALSMFAGALLAAGAERRLSGGRSTVTVIAAGLVAGESLVGVTAALARMLAG